MQAFRFFGVRLRIDAGQRALGLSCTAAQHCNGQGVAYRI